MIETSRSALIEELAHQLIARIGEFFESVRPGVRHPIAEFAIEAGRNAVYVLYTKPGLPLSVGVLRASDDEGTISRRQSDIEWLISHDCVATYRIVELGHEAVAVGMARLLVDLFGASLPFVNTEEIGEMENVEAGTDGASILGGFENVLGMATQEPQPQPQPQPKRRGRKPKNLVAQNLTPQSVSGLFDAMAAGNAAANKSTAPHAEQNGSSRTIEERSEPEQSRVETAAPVAVEPEIANAPAETEMNDDAATDTPVVAEAPATHAASTPAAEENASAQAPTGDADRGDDLDDEDDDDAELATIGDDNGSTSNSMATMFGNPSGLPLTKNQRRELRRRQIEMMKRDSLD